MKILLADDDRVVETIALALVEQRYTIDIAQDGSAAIKLAESFTYDLIILSVRLPAINGISLSRYLRSRGNQTPILLLTDEETSTQRIEGLDAGADDYAATTVEIQELLARIRALLRRSHSTLLPILQWKNLRLDPSNCQVMWNDKPLNLTPKQYALLELFLRNNQRVFSSNALIDLLWSTEEAPTLDTVRSHIRGLRTKFRTAGIKEDPIETVYGVGYRLKPDRKT